MNREIKFRVFNKQIKKMEYDIQSTYDWEFMPLSTGEDENYSLMQYTGLKDKNGKEFFEGDIVKIEHENFDSLDKKIQKGFIKWDNERSLFYIENLEYKTINPNKNWEIIGNIYENPELL